MNRQMPGVEADTTKITSTTTPSDQQSDGEEVLRAFFNANSDDYMAYWDADLVLKVANFHVSKQYMSVIKKVLESCEPARFEADQNGQTLISAPTPP